MRGQAGKRNCHSRRARVHYGWFRGFPWRNSSTGTGGAEDATTQALCPQMVQRANESVEIIDISGNNDSVIVLDQRSQIAPDTIAKFSNSKQSEPTFSHFTLPHRWFDYSTHNRTPRTIVIDGPNVARTFGTRTNTFAIEGLFIMYDYFHKMGHRSIKIFVPSSVVDQSYTVCKVTGRSELQSLIALNAIETPPCKLYPDGRIMQPYDDRFILEFAYQEDAVVVSNDKFRDILNENSRFKHVVTNRVLVYMWANKRLMFPNDPNGRIGPNLLTFLSKSVDGREDEYAQRNTFRTFRNEQRRCAKINEHVQSQANIQPSYKMYRKSIRKSQGIVAVNSELATYQSTPKVVRRPQKRTIRNVKQRAACTDFVFTAWGGFGPVRRRTNRGGGGGRRRRRR
ncbi:hypothetical protein ACOME3_009961 [Neoechinorhynchus agilis]